MRKHFCKAKFAHPCGINNRGRIMGRAPAVRQNLDVESSRRENENIVRVGNEGCANFALRPGLCAGGILEFPSARTVCRI